MGAWNHGYFDNDGAQDVLVELSNEDGKQWVTVISEALERFDRFLDRDSRGETFRPLTRDELEGQDRAVKEALADLPHLIEAWTAESRDHAPILTDVGDHEAQGAVAAAALIAVKLGAPFVRVPRKLRFPKDFAPTPKMLIDAKRVLSAITAHNRLQEYLSKGWVDSVPELLAFFSSPNRQAK